MVQLFMGLQGSGKTKKLIAAINSALDTESGSVVCIEQGDTLRFDVDYRARLVDASEYGLKGYALLKGFISGLHAGNFDISHIFIDNLYKVAQTKDPAEADAFICWCDQFSKVHKVSFTITVSDDPANVPSAVNYL